MSVELLGEVKIDPRNTLKKVFWGRYFVKEIQPSNLPLKYMPGGRPLGMGDPGNQ